MTCALGNRERERESTGFDFGLKKLDVDWRERSASFFSEFYSISINFEG